MLTDHSPGPFWVLLGLGLSLATSAGATVCENREGPVGSESVVSVEILSPLPGQLVVPADPCPAPVTVTGLYSVTGPLAPIDIYIVIDSSASTEINSGVDLDGDGRDESIYVTEVTAAQHFVRRLDPAYSRVAIIAFDKMARLHHPLSADLASIDTRLERMKSSRPKFHTKYIKALDKLLDEVNRRGDPVNRDQRGLFLSDGQPDETLAEIEARTNDLAAAGVVLDTYALGAGAGPALPSMAMITGGSFTEVSVPGDIVALLPGTAPGIPHVIEASNVTTGAPGTVVVDETAGTFTVDVATVPGPNRVVVTLSAQGANPMTVTCEVEFVLDTELMADAGPDVSGCAGELITLDGAGSVVRPCASPTFSWVAADGTVACATSRPTCDVELDPNWGELTLVVGCADGTCTATDTMMVTAVPDPVLAPVLVATCGETIDLACGGEPAHEHGWDLDLASDSDGDGDPGNDVDVAGCDVFGVPADAGVHVMRALAYDPVTGCSRLADLSFEVPVQRPLRSLTGGACRGEPISLSCGVADPALSYFWDLEGRVDADGDGDPTNDADAIGCDVTTEWPVDGIHLVTCWSEDGTCRLVAAEGTLTVSSEATPGLVTDLRVRRLGSTLRLKWSAVPGAIETHVTRGRLVDIHLERTVAHAAEPANGQGGCGEPAGGPFEDYDDVFDSDDYFYLVVSRSACGTESDVMAGFDGHGPVPRQRRTPAASCP